MIMSIMSLAPATGGVERPPVRCTTFQAPQKSRALTKVRKFQEELQRDRRPRLTPPARLSKTKTAPGEAGAPSESETPVTQHLASGDRPPYRAALKETPTD